MAGSPYTVQVIGVRKVVRQLAAVDPMLRKELGERNKDIGRRIIAKAYPKPETVGAGRGALPRPSAATNELRVMAGGRWRATHAEQWGVKQLPRVEPRPYLIQSAREQLPDFEDEYLDALAEVARKAGFTFRKKASL